jgi:hypothetical protein
MHHNHNVAEATKAVVRELKRSQNGRLGTVIVAALITVFAALTVAFSGGIAVASTSDEQTTTSPAVAKLFSTPTAFAAAQANYELIPGGISRINAKKAWARVSERASVDSTMAQAMASVVGVASFNRNDYTPVGYGTASPGTSNSSVHSDGSLSPAPETANCHVGARVLIVVSKTTGRRMEICTACGNPRLAPPALSRSSARMGARSASSRSSSRAWCEAVPGARCAAG